MSTGNELGFYSCKFIIGLPLAGQDGKFIKVITFFAKNSYQ
jgi:hypothetical protein